MYKEYDIAPSNTKNFDLKIFAISLFKDNNYVQVKM